MFDEILNPILRSDSSFRGYVQPDSAAALLVSNGLQGFEQRAIMRFPSRPDSVDVGGTLRGYTIDSVVFGFSVVARDTMVSGVQVQLYRLPRTIDTTTTYADADPAFIPGNLVATIAVPDTVKTGPIRTLIQGTDLAQVQIPPADSGVLALGVRIEAPTLTGVRLGAAAARTGGVFVTYATLDIPDAATPQLTTFPLAAAFNSSLSQVQQTDDSTLLAVGGEPSARALLRFDLPPRIKDSATIVRATLELTPVATITGLPNDPARLQARAVLTDLGAKSPVNSTAGRVPADTLDSGTSGTVSLEALGLVELWLGNTTRPAALVLALAPELESASFFRPVFYSSRAIDPGQRPRLRISYLLSFPFENP
jgi:hypothetical protein